MSDVVDKVVKYSYLDFFDKASDRAIATVQETLCSDCPVCRKEGKPCAQPCGEALEAVGALTRAIMEILAKLN